MSLKITWLGHAAFLLEGNDRIVIDPFLTDNPVATNSPKDISCDIICVTHGHSDHTGDAAEIAKRNDADILAIVELASYYDKIGCRATGFNIGGSVEVRDSIFSMTPAIHSSGADAEGLEGSGLEGGAGVPVGFVIESGRTVYHSGDTALFSDMRLIGEQFSIDVAMLPIGGYYTMDYRRAARAVELLRPKVVIPMHYDTWPPIQADPEQFRSEVTKTSDAEVKILKPGESLSI